MEKFDRVIVKTNRETFNPVGLNLLHPRANAYLFVRRLTSRGRSADELMIRLAARD